MRRSFWSTLAVLIFAMFLAMPVSATASSSPKRNDDFTPGRFIERVIRVIKKITTMDDARPNQPLPSTDTTTTT